MTVWLVVEPLWLDFDAAVTVPRNSSAGKAKSIEFKDNDELTHLELKMKLKQLLEGEKHSLEQAAAEVGISVTTVRRIVRTLELGRYAPESRRKGVLSRSSQVPFGWASEQGMLHEDPAEMKWVRVARDLRAQGQSYHDISRYFHERGVPTKNGGRWHAKTISQILDFNSRMSSRGKGR